MFNAKKYKIKWYDKLFLFRKNIVSAYHVSSSCIIFYCAETEGCVYLKFSYSGNVQYHKISNADIESFIEHFMAVGKQSYLQN